MKKVELPRSSPLHPCAHAQCKLVHGDLPRQHYSFGTTLRFTCPVPADSRQ